MPEGVRNFYVAIPVGYKCCPDIKCDTLKELVLPTLSNVNPALLAKVSLDPAIKALNSYGINPAELEYTTLKMSGDPRVTDANPKVLSKTGTYTPTGRIQYTDNSTNKILGCIGARITYGYSYYWKATRCDANGNFTGEGGWNWGVDYHLHFDSDDFEFKNYNMVEGPVSVKSAWNKTFSSTDFWSLVACAYDACWKSWYGDMESLGRPHQNAWYNFKLGINCYNRYGSWPNGTNFASNPLYGTEYIDLFFQNFIPGDLDKCDIIYYVILHEVSHCTHLDNLVTRNPALTRGMEYGYNVETHVKESYSTGVAIYFSKKRYPKTGYGEQCDDTYTPIICDLVDMDPKYSPSWSGGDDYVYGYTMADMKQFYRSFTWGEVARGLWANRRVPFTKENYDWLFYFYQQPNRAFDAEYYYNTYITDQMNANAPYTNKWYKIVSAYNTNLCLDISLDAPLGNRSNIHVWTYAGTPNQQWKIQNNSDGSRTLISRANSSLVADACLDLPMTDGTNVFAYTSAGTLNQGWELCNISGSNYVITSKYYQQQYWHPPYPYWQPVPNKNLCLDIGNAGGIKNGSNVQLWSYGGGLNQQWQFVEVQ